ncbi:disintegrin and metalloproteinase domain-containing protein 2 isoform X4 [Saimiri boliviensis]|uniref:Disintegrin and metalloproteinase domain-containing protein 2 n=1 Tax=Saimiri boliviensis boliviensis TaxID=39432 RepID=A0A2K6SQ38_SAIBB
MWRVLLLLSGLGGLRMEGNFGNLPVQITVPEKIRSIKKEGIESQIFYKIVIEGKPYTVNLMQKNFLPNNFRVYGYSHTGIMKPLDQDLQNFCHYQGYIEGYPKSVVMVSTCTGLRGLLQFENVSYGIEPLESSVGFEHVIYQVKQKKADVSLYTEKDIESRDLPYKIQSIEHPRTISLESLAVILAQLLSLSMGITYDDIHKCHCSGAVCVMNPEAIHFSGVKIFSNCSIEDFAHFISKQKSQCLHNQPRLDLFFKQQPVCGNAILEAGEECDCGTEENCTFFGATCCDSATCRFKAGFKCAEGPCCENCLFSSKQRECRSAFDECDLPEYCNGSSASCPENHYIQTGHPCGMNQWLCIDGVCMTGDKQCKDMFGQEAEFGPAECYSHLNSKTDISGNCGKVDSGYTPCGADGHLCVAVEFPSDHADSQKTWIKDGTSCGSNKACRNQRCVSSSYLGYDCTQQKCNSKGVCNNKKHCHCSPSYLPPNCAVQSDSWPGGSIDSGNFPPTANNLPQRRFIENIYHSKPMRWPLFLFIPFFIIFCVLIAIMVKVYFQRKKWRTEDYSSDEQLESESEPKG